MTVATTRRPGRPGRLVTAVRALAAMTLAATLLTLAAPSGNSAVVDAAVGGQASRYVAISPERVLDTRDPGFGITGDGDTLSVDALTTNVIAAAGVDALDVEAVAVNLTITEPIAPSWLKSLPTALATPDELATSAVNNRIANENIANFSIVPVGPNGRISIQSKRGSHIVVDVQGVFERSTLSTSGRFVPLTVPTRITDTRKTQTPVPANGDLVIDLTTVGIPATASAALINMVATETRGSGHLTAHPGGLVPDSSNVNYTGVNHTIAGSAIVGLSNGKATIHASVGATHLVVDVIGYMTGTSAPASSSGLFVPFTPERHYDSRADEIPFGTTPLQAGTSRGLQIAGRLSVPLNGVLGVATNLTMTNTDGPGHLVMYPKDPVPEEYSSVNSMVANHSIANHAIARLDNGQLRVHSHGRSDFIVDISGYFLDGTTTPPTTPDRTATNPGPMPDVNPGVIPPPPADNDYEYLFNEFQGISSFTDARNGSRHLSWDPCQPITYAVNTERATQEQIDAMNRAIRTAEEASGIDFVYIGEATGSLDLSNIDPRVGGQAAMAVIGFSDPYSTPNLDGGTIGIGGIGPTIFGSPVTAIGSQGWIVRGGFALIDITDIITPAAIESAFAHELGHMLGLDHVAFNSSTLGELMRPVISNPPQTFFGNGDKNGLYKIGEPQCLGGAPLLADAPTSAVQEIDVTFIVED